MNHLNGTTEINILPDPATYRIEPPEPLGRGYYRLRLIEALTERVLVHEIKLGSLTERWQLADRLYPGQLDTEAMLTFQQQIDAMAEEVIAAGRSPDPELQDWDAMMDQPSISWLVDGILPCGVMASLTGRWGSGKSFLAGAWAISIAAGRDWLGHRTAQGGAIYVAAEGYKAERLDAYHQRWPLDTTPRLWFRRGKLSIAQPHAVDAFLRQIDKLPNTPKLIVIDTLPRCMSGLNENDASDMAMVIDGSARLIDATGATVLHLLHPPQEKLDGPSAERSRGSGALDGACDTTLFLKKKSTGLELRITKQKDGDIPPPLALVMSNSGNALVIDRDVASESADKMGHLVLSFLRIVSAMENPLGAKELRDYAGREMGVANEVSQEVLTYCKAKGYINTPMGKKHAYTVTERGRVVLLNA